VRWQVQYVAALRAGQLGGDGGWFTFGFLVVLRRESLWRSPGLTVPLDPDKDRGAEDLGQLLAT
jgi:hypothetical protein